MISDGVGSQGIQGPTKLAARLKRTRVATGSHVFRLHVFEQLSLVAIAVATVKTNESCF